jgi:uncharacterized protein YegP (UPF0339 family)
MAGKFIISKSSSGNDFFTLKAGNGEVILTSQQYASRKSCDSGVDSVRNNCANASRFEIKTAKDGREYFVLKASNGQVIGQSQMYKSGSGCKNGIVSGQRSAPDAKVDVQEG